MESVGPQRRQNPRKRLACPAPPDGSMRVLHVVDSLGAGGMENGVVNLAHGLASRGIEAHVACLRERGAFADRLPIPERACAMGKGVGFSPGAAWRLACHITQVQPHVLHTHNLGPLIYAALATLWGMRRPILHGEHSRLTPGERQPRRLRQRRLFYRTCHHIHTVAPAICEDLASCGLTAANLSVISNGVDTDRFCPGDRLAARRAMALPENSLCIGLVGRFGLYKRHDLLIEAFEQIADRLPAAHLVFAGAGGPEEDSVKARAASSAHGARIHFVGLQRSPAVVYQALDLLAIPSVNEGLSNVALEAMACAVPVMGNTGCGHEHIIDSGHDGLITSLQCAQEIASELLSFFCHLPQSADWGNRARAKVQARFSLRQMLDAYEHHYRLLTGR